MVRHWDLEVRQYEAVVGVTGTEGDFTVVTRSSDGTSGMYAAAAVSRPGIYIAGVVFAGNDANNTFIENGLEHGGRIERDRLRRTAR